MINSIFNDQTFFKAGFATNTTGQVALDAIAMQETALISDDGSDIELSITTGTDAPTGFFSFVTDTRIHVNRVSEIGNVTNDEGEEEVVVTNLKVLDFPAPTEFNVAGKVFYLYQAINGPALSIGDSTTKVFRIKYIRISHFTGLTSIGPIHKRSELGEKPTRVKSNTLYAFTSESFSRENWTPAEEELNRTREHIMLPDNPHIGDVIELGVIRDDYNYDPYPCWPQFCIAVTKNETKINGVVFTEILYTDAIHVRIMFSGNPDLGWIVTVITPSTRG